MTTPTLKNLADFEDYYVVLGNHTLGCLIPGCNRIEIISSSILLGGYSWLDSPIELGDRQVRRANLEDFKSLRCLPPKDYSDLPKDPERWVQLGPGLYRPQTRWELSPEGQYVETPQVY